MKGERAGRPLFRPRRRPADERRGALQVRLPAHAGADQELADLPAQASRVGGYGVEVDIGGHAVERAAQGDQGAGVFRHRRRAGVVEHRPGVGQLAPDVQKRAELHRRRLAHRAAQQRPLAGGAEAPAAVDDAAGELPGPGAGEGALLRRGVEIVQKLRPQLDEEQHLRGDARPRAPGAPVLRVHPDLQVHEARGQRGGHAVDHAAVALAVAAGDQRGPLGQFVFPHRAVEHQLVQRRLHHGRRRGQFLEVDQPAAGVVRGRQEGRRRPAGAAVAVAPGDAAQVHRVEQQGADIHIPAPGASRHLLGDLGFGGAGRPPDDAGLARLDQQRQGRGEFGRAQGVVRGQGFG